MFQVKGKGEMGTLRISASPWTQAFLPTTVPTGGSCVMERKVAVGGLSLFTLWSWLGLGPRSEAQS